MRRWKRLKKIDLQKCGAAEMMSFNKMELPKMHFEG